jgi:hypothetical protein
MEMRINKRFMGALVMSVALVAAGCAKPPQQEVDALKANIASAEAEASKYASEAWTKTQDAMNQVNAELEAQNAKFALFRSYSKTKELVATANASVEEAKTAAIAGTEKAKADAQAASASPRVSPRTWRCSRPTGTVSTPRLPTSTPRSVQRTSPAPSRPETR